MASFLGGTGVAKIINKCADANRDNTLDLSNCKLIQVPEAVYILMKNVCVEIINLTNNEIKRLPIKFGVVFSGISELRLSKNRFCNLPEELKGLSNLKTLDISFNNFTYLPHVVYELPKLKFLNAEKNSIMDVDPEILQEMSSLEEINLYNNPLPETLQDKLNGIAPFRVLVGEPPEEEN